MKVQILTHTPNPEQTVAMAGKLCYSPVGIDDINGKLTDAEIDKFVKHVVSIGHGSVLEHISFTFGIEGISRITEIQLARHRVATSLSVQSGRYVKRNVVDFIAPPSIQNNNLAKKVFDDIGKASMKAYNDLFLLLMLDKMGYKEQEVELMSDDDKIKNIELLMLKNKKHYSKLEKECIEDARYSHLQSLSTKLVITMNGRSLLHFLELRCCKRSQWEIRLMAYNMLRLVKEVAPSLFKTAGASCVKGKCPEGSKSCGNPKGKIK